MKLSEAIRLGEFALPPIKWVSWFRMNDDNIPCGACAVGRLLYAIGYKPKAAFESFDSMLAFAQQHWPWITKGNVGSSSPKGTRTEEYIFKYPFRSTLLHRISDLYECDDWSMSQIADWVATIEPQDEVQPVTQEVATLVEVP